MIKSRLFRFTKPGLVRGMLVQSEQGGMVHSVHKKGHSLIMYVADCFDSCFLLTIANSIATGHVVDWMITRQRAAFLYSVETLICALIPFATDCWPCGRLDDNQSKS